MAVKWGRTHQDWRVIQAIGIDELAWKTAHKYLTLVDQIDGQDERRVKTLLRFFRWLGKERS